MSTDGSLEGLSRSAWSRGNSFGLSQLMMVLRNTVHSGPVSPSDGVKSPHTCMLETALCHAMQALAMQDAYEAEDEVDDAADDAEEAQQKRSRAAALASGSPLPDTSAYFHERLYWGAHWTQCCMAMGRQRLREDD